MNACATFPVTSRSQNDGARRRSVACRPGVPCPCPADGVMLAVGASPGQGTLQVAAEKSPPDGLRYTAPISFMPKLGQINSTMQYPLDRYNAVMALPALFTVEPLK